MFSFTCRLTLVPGGFWAGAHVTLDPLWIQPVSRSSLEKEMLQVWRLVTKKSYGEKMQDLRGTCRRLARGQQVSTLGCLLLLGAVAGEGYLLRFPLLIPKLSTLKSVKTFKSLSEQIQFQSSNAKPEVVSTPNCDFLCLNFLLPSSSQLLWDMYTTHRLFTYFGIFFSQAICFFIVMCEDLIVITWGLCPESCKYFFMDYDCIFFTLFLIVFDLKCLTFSRY